MEEKTNKKTKLLTGVEMYNQAILNAQKNGATKLIKGYTKAKLNLNKK